MTEKENEEVSALEDVGGALSAANEATGKGVLSKLLGPACEIWGAELEDLARWTVKWRKKNIQSHKDAVFAKKPEFEKIEPTLKRVKSVADWHEVAQDTGEDELEEASLWRAVLDEILSKHDESCSLISIAKRLDKQRIESLKVIQNKLVLEDKFSADKYDLLVEIGLARREPLIKFMKFSSSKIIYRFFQNTNVINGLFGFALWMVVLMGMVGIDDQSFMKSVIEGNPKFTYQLYVSTTVAFVLGVLVVIFNYLSWRLHRPCFVSTKLGNRLIKKMAIYKEAIPDTDLRKKSDS